MSPLELLNSKRNSLLHKNKLFNQVNTQKIWDKRFIDKLLSDFSPKHWLQNSIYSSRNMSKKILSTLIAHQQIAYVQKRCISETGRLIFDNLEILDALNPKVYLVSIDIE